MSRFANSEAQLEKIQMENRGETNDLLLKTYML